MTSKPTAYLANMLYVPSSLVKTEHMHAYTYEIESSQSTPQTHLPIVCENCQMWGLQWRKPNQGTCASIGYTQNDSCGMFRPKVDKVKVTTEVTTWSQEGDYFLFPRGDLGKLDRVFGDIPIHDMRVAPPLGFELSMKPNRVLRPDQQEVADRWMQCGYGIIQAPTGYGKCVSAHTYLHTDRGLVQIKNVVPHRQDDHAEPVDGLHVVASAGYKQKVSHAYYQASKPTLRVKTELGFAVEGTHVHPLLVIDPEHGLMWKTLREITTADYVAVRSAPIGGTPPSLAGFDVPQHHNEKPLQLPPVFTTELAEFFGAMVADGTVRSTHQSYTKTDPVLVASFRSALNGMGIHVGVDSDRANNFRFGSTAFGRFAQWAGLAHVTAAYKTVPWIVRTSGMEIARAFLRGYFSGDGEIDPNTRMIACSSASKELIEVIQLMLLSFGIPARLRVKPVVPPGHTEPRDYYLLSVYRQHVALFEREIGFITGSAKAVALRHALEVQEACVKTASSAQQLVRLPVNHWMRSVYSTRTTKTGLRSLNLEQCLGKRATPPDLEQLRAFLQHFDNNHPDAEKLRAVYEYASIPGVFFTQVTAIEDAGVQEVMDLSVPGTEWFMGNGIVNHNTVLMCHLFTKLGVRALVLADKVRHLQVVEEGLREHTDIDEVEKELGYALYGELGTQVKFKPNGDRYVVNKPGTVYPITFSTYQSLTSKNGRALLPHLRDYFGVVWHEESHHEAAETFHEVTKSFNPYYRGGQTATPERGDKLHIVMFDTIGPVTAMATTEMMKPRAQFIHTGVLVPDHLFRGQYATPRVETWLAGNSEYFEHVLETICEDLANGRKVLVFSKRKKFNVKLSRAIHLRGYAVEVIDGNTKKVKEQSWYAQQLQEGNLNCIIGTQVIQENFNIPPLDCLHLPFTNFTEGLEKQVVGRVLRSNVANKPQPLVRVYTWESTQKLAQTAVHWRRKLYSKFGYDFDPDKNLGPSLQDSLRDFW